MLTDIENEDFLNKSIQRARERGIILPTFSQMKDPDQVPEAIINKLRKTGLWDLDPINLFRITWKNEPKEFGGAYGSVNHIVLPREFTGVDARIALLTGKWFPTGAHKVGAAYGCLVPKIISGQFDPTYHKAVWPSTGNYCRGGAFDSYLLGVTAVAILPEEMSRERFDWLREIGAEVIATPGCESNVKEIYDACWNIKRNRKDCIIFNQFEEFGNSCWHYKVTGTAVLELANSLKGNLAAYVSATGSAGTIAAGDCLKKKNPNVKIVASEALQCPTLLNNGFGAHRIEGIGDKHVPWIHNVKNTDMVTAIDDEDCMRLLRLFNENSGKKFLKEYGIAPELVDMLPVIGISGISNIISAIKTARYFELTSDDIIISIATDSAEMYQSRLNELNEARGPYSEKQAALDFEKCLLGTRTDSMKELSYQDKKSIHNLKYYTWVEQQGKTYEEINSLWYDNNFWKQTYSQISFWDDMIDEFNDRTGLLKNL